MKGLMVYVYRSSLGDCTNGGVSGGGTPGGHDRFVLVKNGAELGPFEPDEKDPALFLAKWYGRVIACPANLEELCPPELRNTAIASSIGWLGNWMFGGNFVYTSDARFSDLAGGYPIPIYDRREA